MQMEIFLTRYETDKNKKTKKKAGAELGQAQPRLGLKGS